MDYKAKRIMAEEAREKIAGVIGAPGFWEQSQQDQFKEIVKALAALRRRSVSDVLRDLETGKQAQKYQRMPTWKKREQREKPGAVPSMTEPGAPSWYQYQPNP